MFPRKSGRIQQLRQLRHRPRPTARRGGTPAPDAHRPRSRAGAASRPPSRGCRRHARSARRLRTRAAPAALRATQRNQTRARARAPTRRRRRAVREHWSRPTRRCARAPRRAVRRDECPPGTEARTGAPAATRRARARGPRRTRSCRDVRGSLQTSSTPTGSTRIALRPWRGGTPTNHRDHDCLLRTGSSNTSDRIRSRAAGTAAGARSIVQAQVGEPCTDDVFESEVGTRQA
jgi:hypothetical protein